jgi:hypothetical protein
MRIKASGIEPKTLWLLSIQCKYVPQGYLHKGMKFSVFT